MLGRPCASPAWMVNGTFSRRRCSKAARWSAGGNPSSAPAMSKPTTPASRNATARSAASRTRSNIRIPHSRVPTRTGVPAAAAFAMPAARPSWTVSTTSGRVSPPFSINSGA